MKTKSFMIVYVIHSIAAIFFCLSISISIPAFSVNFYSYEYDKNNTAAVINADKDELMAVTTHMLGYLRGSNDNLNIKANIGGEERLFFNERELAHMVDVKLLFNVLYTVRRISFFTALLTLFAVISLDAAKAALAKVYKYTLAVVLTASFMLAGLVALNFNKAFTIFHELFFNNDLWILNPKTDLLVNIVPTPFFIDIALFTFTLFILFQAAYYMLLKFCLYKRK